MASHITLAPSGTTVKQGTSSQVTRLCELRMQN
jgi:hypothetical protein